MAELSNSAQENLLTLLGFDDHSGMIVADLISPEYFEGEYRVIASFEVNA